MCGRHYLCRFNNCNRSYNPHLEPPTPVNSFDNLPTLLTFGTFYNTYREKNLKFFIVQLYVNIVRALAFGALQPSGIAQITILAICEIVLVLTVYGIKPYAPATSMNAWQAIFAMIRLLTILLMMTFVPSMDAGGAARAWIGYVILVIHALVLIFGFFFMAVQTMLELFIRGCGGADDGEAARGGLAKVSWNILASPGLLRIETPEPRVDLDE